MKWAIEMKKRGLPIIKQKTRQVNDISDIDTGLNPDKKILILSANPKITPRMRFDEEVREIQEGLRRSKHREQFDIHSRLAVRVRDLRQALLDIEPHIVHFTGHGKEDGLLVEDEIGSVVRISTEALAGLFELFSGQVECVILSACFSAPQAVAISKHIDYVIGMRKEIKDKAAVGFAVGFYDGLGAGKSVEEAFKFGCNAIQQMFPDLPEHLIPVLKRKKGLEKQNNGVEKITKRKKQKVNIRICIETTGDIFDTQVSLDARTSVVKNRLIRELIIPKIFGNEQPNTYYLLSKTRDEIMDDNRTLRENGVQDNEVFLFLVEIDDEYSESK